MTIIEGVADASSSHDPYCLYFTPSMNVLDIKKEIGRFVFRMKRWPEQEDIAVKLLSSQKVNLDMFHTTYDTTEYQFIFEQICSDVFAVYYGNPSMSLDEISLAVNSIYIKKFAENQFSFQSKIDEMVQTYQNESKN